MPNSLSVSSLVNVTVSVAPTAAQGQNTNALLLLGDSAVIPVTERIRFYSTLAQVTADFGGSGPEFTAANLYFQQSPQPVTLAIGRWASAATSGQLLGGTLPGTALAALIAVASGGFKVAVDGGAVTNVASIVLTGQTTFSGIAGQIQTALTGAGLACTITYDAPRNRFVITSNSTGSSSSISFLTSPTAGTDISALLAGTAATGATQSVGIVAETPVSAATLFDTNFGQSWYALMFAPSSGGFTVLTASSNAQYIAVANFIQGSANYHYFQISSQDATMLNSGTAATQIAGQLQTLGLNKSNVQYSSSSAFAGASLMGRVLPVNYAANNSAITLMYKQEPGIVAETLTQTQATNLASYNANVFAAYNNATAIIQFGTNSDGSFIDTSIGTANLAIGIQTAVFNVLFTSPTKISQTDQGVAVITNAISAVCSQFVLDGLLAPGTWNAVGFGSLKQGDFLTAGFYVFAPPVATQLQSQRAARISVPIQVAAKLAGAVQTVNVAVTINS